MSESEPLIIRHIRPNNLPRPEPKPEAGAGGPAPPEGVHRDAEPRAVCLAPDVCKTPVGSTLVPVPYQVWGKAEDAENFATSVYFRGTPAMRFNSVFSKTYGDEPAQDKGGVKSGARGGKVEPTSHSPTVNIQKSPAVRNRDRCTLNGGNTPGEFVLSRDRTACAPPKTDAANTSPAQPDGASSSPPNTYMAKTDPAQPEGASGAQPNTHMANTAPAQPDAPRAGAAGPPTPGADVDWWSGALATDQSAEASAEVWRKGRGAAAEWATEHPQTMGAIQAAGALAEAGGAAALVVSGTAADATGVGAPVGVALQALGWAGLMDAADNLWTDVRQMWYGAPQETLGRQAAGAVAQAAGASPATVEQIKAFTGAAQTVVGGVAGMGGLARVPAGAAVASRAVAAAGTGKRSAEKGLRVTGEGGASSPPVGMAHTGANKTVPYWDFDAAEKAYDTIRSVSGDVNLISKNTGIKKFQINRIKDHLFYKFHHLDGGLISRFDAHPEIANAWNRLSNGSFTTNDLQLIKHELFESKFEGIFKTDYRTAHEAANKAGHLSGLE
ncbi:PAAR-like domain-containing protein [Methylobacterium sp. B1]|uniref:PAAR-like domain-containing protein n=1 Tax=Methylobacterium sp. B1 TaxID=91459 RepID=UPI0003488152|nr:PAAR-like domain-containing protein [Methylobacterium sp. B1]